MKKPSVSLPAPLPGLPAAQLPDDALGAGLAVVARVGAGQAFLQALTAVPIFHLVTPHVGFPVRVKTAFHLVFCPPLSYSIRKSPFRPASAAERQSPLEPKGEIV